MSGSSMSCELAFVKLSVFSACRFTQTLSAATSASTHARTTSTHGTQRRQPVAAVVASRGGAFAAASGGRATFSLAKAEPPRGWYGAFDFRLSGGRARHPCRVIWSVIHPKRTMPSALRGAQR